MLLIDPKQPTQPAAVLPEQLSETALENLLGTGLDPAVSCERRNISAIIRTMGSGEARCSVDEQTMDGD